MQAMQANNHYLFVFVTLYGFLALHGMAWQQLLALTHFPLLFCQTLCIFFFDFFSFFLLF